MKECGLFLRFSPELELAGVMAMMGIPVDIPLKEPKKEEEPLDEQPKEERSDEPSA